MSDRSIELLDIFRRMDARRSEWDSWFQMLADVFWPNQADFTTKFIRGKRRDTKNFENSHRVAARNFATTIDTFIGPQDKSQLTVEPDDEELAERDDVREWLDIVQARMWRAMSRASAGLKQARAETNSSLTVLGTGVMFIGENRLRNGLQFRSHHLRSVALGVDDVGKVDRLGYTRQLTASQAVLAYGEANIGEKTREALKKSGNDHLFEFVHLILPRNDRDARKMNAGNMAFASVAIDVESEHIIEENGFHEFPFAVARWETSPGEIYARSPAMMAFSDARTLQSIAKTLLLGGQRAVDPPSWVLNDAVISAVRNYPGGMTVFDTQAMQAMGGRPPMGVLDMGKNIPLGREMQGDYRELVQSAFFRDLFASAVDGPGRTATEILERKEEMIRVLGPTFGRLEEDYIGTYNERTFHLMERSGSFPERPEVLKDSKITFSYHSPFQLARRSVEAVGISRSMEMIAPLAAIDPAVMDNYDTDEIARDTPEWFGFAQRYIRDKEEVTEIREGRAKAQQEREAMEQAREGGAAVRDIASAESSLEQAP